MNADSWGVRLATVVQWSRVVRFDADTKEFTLRLENDQDVRALLALFAERAMVQSSTPGKDGNAE